MKHISLIVLLCTSFFLSAQNTFFKTFGGTSEEIMYSGNALNTYNKGYLINGYTTSFGSGGNDGYLICLDYDGNLAWSKTIGGIGSDLISYVLSKTNGQIMVAGYYAANSNILTIDAFITELDSMGNIIWSKTYGGSSGIDNINSIRLTSSNEIMTAGQSESIQPGGLRDVVAMKLSPTGNVIWSRVFGGGQNDWGMEMEENANGYLLTGNTFSYGAGNHDGFLVQLDNNGNITWMKTMGTSNDDRIGTLEVTNNGDAIIGGFTYVGGNRRGWVQRLNSAGNIIWSKNYFASGYEIWAKTIVANDGNILLFGSEVTNSGRFVILKINENTGNIIWVKEYGGVGKEITQGFFQTPDGGINGVGYTNSYSIDNDAFILRTDANGNMEGNCSVTNVSALFNSVDFTYSTQNITPQQQTNYPSANATLNIANAPTVQNIVCEGIQALFNIENPVICVGECTNMIDSSIGATSWNWSFQGANIASSSSQNPTNICYSAVGNYDIQLIISNGTSFDTLTKTITVTDVPQVDLGADITICEGENLLLDGTTNGASYLWSTGATTPTISINIAGTYWIEATIGTCVAQDTIVVSTFSLPVVSLGNDTSFCDVNAFTLNAFSSNVATYLWQGNSTLDSFVVNNTGDYSVTITDGNGCQGVDTINLNFYNTPNLNLGNDTVICQYQTVLLDAFALDATYFWNDSTTNSTLSVTETGTYIVTVSLGTCQISDTINVDVTPTPFIFLGNDTMICEGMTASLSAEDATATDYSWQDGSSLSSFEVSEAGTYSVFVNYNNGCFNTDTIEFLPELPIYPTLPTDTFFCKNTELILNAYQENVLSYQWQGFSAYWELNDYQSSSFIINLEGSYSVTINNGCRDLLQNISVTKGDCGCYPFIPNAFTPNNDGNNDAFQISNNCPISNYELRIFDRWGGLSFKSNDINEHWDGTVNGEDVKGVYVWMLTYETLGSDGKDETRLESGDVTVLR